MIFRQMESREYGPLTDTQPSFALRFALQIPRSLKSKGKGVFEVKQIDRLGLPDNFSFYHFCPFLVHPSLDFSPGT
jgi:hypothetical protein